MSLVRFALIALAVFAAPLSAQSNVVSGFVGRSQLTSPDGFTMPTIGASYERALTSWFGVSVEGGIARSADTNPARLVIVVGDWHERTQVVGTLSAVAYPARFGAFGVTHRFGLLAGPTVRYKNESFQYAGFEGTIAPGTDPAIYQSIRDLNADWVSRGPNHRVIQFEHAGGGAELYPDVDPTRFEPGLVNALVLDNAGVDVGLTGGLAYEGARGPAVISVRTQYRRYRDQRAVTGSHGLDLVLRVGYRF